MDSALLCLFYCLGSLGGQLLIFVLVGGSRYLVKLVEECILDFALLCLFIIIWEALVDSVPVYLLVGGSGYLMKFSQGACKRPWQPGLLKKRKLSFGNILAM